MIKLGHLFGAAVAVLVVAGVFAATPAFATQSIGSFESTLSTTKSGGHPDIHTSFKLENPGAPEAARNVIFNTPQGVFGNPRAITECSPSNFALQQCPSDSQAGLITVYANYENNHEYLLGTAPLFIVDPGANQAALLAFIVPILNIPIDIPVTVRTTEDYGLRFTVSNISQLTPLAGADITIWAYPAADEHNVERFPKGSLGAPAGCPKSATAECVPQANRSGISVHPLTDNPSLCTGQSQPVTLEVETYQDPGKLSRAETSYPPVTDCERQVFKPVLSVNPTTTEADSPAGLDVQLSTPQFLGFAASPSQIRTAIVDLAPGLTINPDAADGQTACSDAQANFDSEGPANCPDSAKIGTIGIHSTALDGTLEGSIYIGEPMPGAQYRLLMIVSGFGLNAKLVGTFHPDPETGQVTARFEDLPQVPFDLFDIHLFSSDRGLLATPITCTVHESTGRFLPWNDRLADVTARSHFSIASGPDRTSCPGQIRPFHPRLEAGTTSSVAGAHTAFSLELERDDGDQFLGDITFRMPPGLTASLRGIAYCPEASIGAAAQNPGRNEQVNPSCPAASQIGTTNVAAGPGGYPFNVSGKMYLAGPFKGAPLSVVAVTPALAGPFDYGTQVVRVAIEVDSDDAHVFAVSDKVPAIIGGVPIRMRKIRVNIDRQNFMISPTNCSPFTVDSQGIGDQGTVVGFSSYFHADNCQRLGFKPKMRIRQVGSRKSTHRASNPKLLFDLWTRPGDANIKSLSVTLSHAFEIDQRHLGNICSEKELAEKQCAGRTPIGIATTATPLLDQPLSGPVYAVSGSGGLPRLAFVLNGQVNLLPRADAASTKDGRLRTTVAIVPDAPIGHFALTVFGGKAGYLINTRDICSHTPVVKVGYTAQSGKTRNEAVSIKTVCRKGTKKHSARSGRHAR
jgi:hypothetical protein